MGSLGSPMVRANTLVEPPGGRPARCRSRPGRWPPRSGCRRRRARPRRRRRRAAAPWARRVAWPRRLVSATVTSWSADSAFRITTRLRAVTDDAEELTSSSTFRRPDGSRGRFGPGRGRDRQSRHVCPQLEHFVMNVVVCVKQIPDPAEPGRAGSRDQHAQARRQAHPRRVRLLRRRDGPPAGRQRRRRRGHPRLHGPQQRDQRPAHRPRHGRRQGHPRQRRGPRRLRRARAPPRCWPRPSSGSRARTSSSPPPSRATATRARCPSRSPSCSACPSVTFAKEIARRRRHRQGPAPDRGRLRRGRAARSRPWSR